MIYLLALLLALPMSLSAADNINMTISGQSQEKPDLESLNATPNIPSIDSLALSDDDEISINNNIDPLTLGIGKSAIPTPLLPLIPSSPFLVQAEILGDDPHLPYLKQLGVFKRKSAVIDSWVFHVRDEQNQEVFVSSGKGTPSSNFVWNGKDTAGKFVLNPNHTYNSYVVYTSTEAFSITVPGESERFVALLFETDQTERILFGDRVYEDNGASFSKEGQFYLADVRAQIARAYRQHQVLFSTEPAKKLPLTIRLIEPNVFLDADLIEQRRSAWRNFVADIIPRAQIDELIKVDETRDSRCSVEITLPLPPKGTRPAMGGRARDPRPLMEDSHDWIQIKDGRNGELLIDMRHDRLFRIGSAYLRDQAIPLLLTTIKRVQQERDSKKRIVLRSYIEKPRDTKKTKTIEEDPKLDALRSKVLFLLLANARYSK